MRFHSLQDWLSWLESCHPGDEIKLGLDRITAVADRLIPGPLLQDKKVVTVAGTNGKGSCVAALNALLRSAGLSVGCYTSPHFLHYNERIVIDDKPVDDAVLMAAFERVDQARGALALTYFEFGTLVALDIFQRSALQVVILEVGLGGRLDAVNIVAPDVAVITSIALDHQNWLGPDRQSIATEKAGIFRAGVPAVCADNDPPQAIQTIADKLGVSVFQLGREFTMTAVGANGYRWQSCATYHRQRVETGLTCNGGKSNRCNSADNKHDAEKPGKLRVSQAHNELANTTVVELSNVTLPADSIAAALQTLQLLYPAMDTVDVSCLETLTLPGRFQCVETDRGQVILDVAHNPAAAHYLAKKLHASAVAGRTFALCTMMRDKDCAGIIQALTAVIDAWFVASVQALPRVMAASDLVGELNKCGVATVSDISGITQAITSGGNGDIAQSATPGGNGDIAQSVTPDGNGDIARGAVVCACDTIAQAYRLAHSQMQPGDRLVVMGSFVTVSAVMTILQGDVNGGDKQ